MALHWPFTWNFSFVLTSQKVPCVLVSQNCVGTPSPHEPVLPTLSPTLRSTDVWSDSPLGVFPPSTACHSQAPPLPYRLLAYLSVHVSFCVGGRAFHHGPLLYFNSLVISKTALVLREPAKSSFNWICFPCGLQQRNRTDVNRHGIWVWLTFYAAAVPAGNVQDLFRIMFCVKKWKLVSSFKKK